jgi:hypothetical protein
MTACLDLMRPIANLSEDDVRDYEQGLCFFCGEGWVLVPGPRGGKGKWTNDHTQHSQDCAYVAIRDYVQGQE